MNVEIKVDAPNGRTPKRVVRFRAGDRQHTDSIDPLDGFARQKCLDRVASVFAVHRHRLSSLDQAIVEAARQSEEQADQVSFRGVSCRELDEAEYALDFLIEETLVASTPAFIGGAQKTLKTLLAVDAAISLATATPFLGKLEVRRAARTGFFSGEGGLPTIQDYARRVCGARGIDLRDVSGITWCDTLPQLEALDHLDALREFITAHELELVVLDPLYLAMAGDDAANLFKQGRILRHLNRVCVEAGCTPILLHHTKRSIVDPTAPAELSDLAWAGFSEFAGQWLLVSRREKYDPDKVGSHRLWLNVGGRAGHGALWALDIEEGRRTDLDGRRWQVNVRKGDEAREDRKRQDRESRETREAEQNKQRLERDRRIIVQTMVKMKRPADREAVKVRTALQSKRFGWAWASLVDDGMIVEAGGGVKKGNNQTYPTFQVSDNGSEL